MPLQYFVFVHHRCGNRHEVSAFQTEAECEAFVCSIVQNDPEQEVTELRIFHGEELRWVPKDIIKSVRFEHMDD